MSINQTHTSQWQPTASLENIKIRARLLQSIRAFFVERNVLEVETPVLSPAAITDPQLESFSTRFQQRDYYLQTSPEFLYETTAGRGQW